MSDNTKDKLIDAAVTLFAVKGFNSTGIAEILAQVKVPKGSFYHYFKSKEDLGLAVIDHYGHILRDGLAASLATNSGSPLTQLHQYFSDVLIYFGEHFGRCNCLLGNLGQELALQSDAMRVAIYRHYQGVEAQIAACFEEAKQAGELAPTADAQLLARQLFAAWEGCLIRSKLEQTTQPLEELLKLYFGQLLKP
ncbi:TetR/AcrR family transcriptional regulator [Cellvibrio sp. OA-2007]|uniref:TetR/AcrR family transcriptional regulator n=1 Tax=Cellvibrio sp. OA-2007 TaxID=529823 RepID=UPI00078314B2|nr:TetR/AcrR family transcriptional regulator [Cellvibrio sp. OA-2007]